MRKPSWPTDWSPRRRRPRRPGRLHNRLDESPRILILCEGAKTETSYFRGLKTASRLTNVVVRPSRAGQPGPRGLGERARDELRNDPGWDEIYCVLDHDGRDSAVGELEMKVAALNRRNRSTRVEMILSDPCFEYWLLLHFELTDRPFVAVGKGKPRVMK